MANAPVVCPKQPIPRDLDVRIVINRPSAEVATDMSLICFLTTSAPFPPDNSRVRFYMDMKSVSADFPANTEGWWAANAFFARSVRPLRLAIGQVFTAPVAAGLVGTQYDLIKLKAITDGSFSFVVDDVPHDIEAMDFSTVTTIADAVTVVNTALTTAGAAATASVKYGGIFIQSNTTGDDSNITYAEDAATGTPVATLLGLTAEAGAKIWDGYVPGTLVDEATLVDTAAKCASAPPYGWVLDRSFRGTDEQKLFADWCESKEPSYFSACTNSVLAYDTADQTNIGYYTSDKGYKRTSVIYHDNPQVYPDMSYLAYALATDYAQPDSAITMKFKELTGIEPSRLTITNVEALDSRRINYYVAMGNTSRVTREGVQSADTWFTDSLVNLDNFKEELQVAIFNVFFRKPKIPYTSAGQNLLISAASGVCQRYVRNGVFSPSEVLDPTAESGTRMVPAFSIRPVSVAQATASERAARIAPPIVIQAFEAGAFHSVLITIDVQN